MEGRWERGGSSVVGETGQDALYERIIMIIQTRHSFESPIETLSNHLQNVDYGYCAELSVQIQRVSY